MNHKQRKQRERNRAPVPTSPYAVDQLSNNQVAARLAAALLVSGPTTEETMERAANWANQARADFGLLELVLHGLVSMRWDDEKDDWVFKKLDRDTAASVSRLAESLYN